MSSQGSPSRTFASPSRNVSNTSNRSHPYQRPSSTHLALADAPSKNIVSSRGFTRSGSQGLPRSGSEPSSLIGGLKSLISKPFSWLASPNPKRGHERDPEDVNMSPPQSSKRIRRKSPSPSPGPRGNYDPPSKRTTMEVQGRAVTGHMVRSNEIPALPSNLSLSKRNGSKGGAGQVGGVTNFSRPLASSQSMPYLDPPTGESPSRPKRNGLLTRSRRVNLAQEAGDDEDMSVDGEREILASPRQAATPTQRDFGLLSNSPFKSSTMNGSPARFAGGSISRSNTVSNLNRAQSVATDVSMASSPRRGGSMLFGQPQESPRQRQDSRMSMDGSVTDWFMRGNSTQPGLTPGRAAAMRTGSLGPNAAFPPIRRGPLVFDSDRGFVRESELRAENSGPVGANEAEKILFALENRRNTPLQSARSAAVPFSQGGPFPVELVGASSRQIRKAINVPLATAQSRETLKSKMEKELRADRERGKSVLISPYARRRAAEDELRAARVAERMERDKEERDRAESEQRDRELSVSMSQDRRSRRTRSVSSALSDGGIDQDEPATTPRRSARLHRSPHGEEESTPKRKEKGKGKVESSRKRTSRQGSPPTETPRRSTRKRTAEKATSPDPPPVPSVPTITETAPSPQEKSTSSYRPRADGDMSRGKSSLKAQADKRRTHEGAASYEPSRANTPGSGRFSARDEDLPDMDELDNQAKIPLNAFSGVSFTPFTSASTSPAPEAPATSATPAEESGSLLSRLGPKPAESSLNVPVRGGPLSRIDKHRPRASSPLAGSSTVAQPESPPQPAPAPSVAPTTGFVSLSAQPSGSTTPVGKPPAVSPFGGFGATTNGAAPASSSLFGNLEPPKKTAGAGLGLGRPSEPAKEPSAQEGIPNFFGKSQPGSGTTTPSIAPVPAFNFGTSSSTPAPATAPAPIVGSSAPGEPSKAFSFGAPSANGDIPGNSFFASKPAETTTKPAAPGAPTSFFAAPSPAAAAKPAEAPKFSFAPAVDTPSIGEPASNPFSFGAPASKPAEAAKPPTPAFSFSQPAKSDEPAKAAPPPFSFSASTPIPDASVAKPSTPAFSFNTPAPPASTAAPKSTFSFGAQSTASTKPDEPAKTASTFGAAPTSGAGSTGSATPMFSFASTASTEKAPAPSTAPPASTGFGASTGGSNGFGGFNFGKPAETAPAATPSTANGGSTSFGFGGNNTAAPAFGATNTGSTTSGGFGNVTSPPSTATPSFSFGATQNGTSGGFGSNNSGGFGTSNAPAQTSNPFNNASTPAPSPFSFGNTNNNASSAPFGAAPATPAPAANGGGGGFSFTFGQNSGAAAPSVPSTPSTPFTFGAPAPSTNSFGSTNNNGFGGTPTNGTNGGFGTPAPPPAFGGGFNTTPSNNSFGQPAGGQGGFGAPAISTPGIGGNQGFSFGAPNAGVPGSPAGGGGFSLGTQTTTPGSPGGRAIKPLRKKR